MYTLLSSINPVVHIVGLAIAVWAYVVTRRRGYILVTLYFLLAAISLTVIPAINRARYRRWQAEHSATSEAQEAYIREMKILEQKYPPPYAGFQKANIPIPLGAAILVAGIWVLASDSRKAEPSAGGNAAAPRASS
jgi:membrane protein YdbS with pleckstrin-like domain